MGEVGFQKTLIVTRQIIRKLSESWNIETVGGALLMALFFVANPIHFATSASRNTFNLRRLSGRLLMNNRCTPEGRELGALLVRLSQPEIARLAAEGEPDERCPSCAFRLGTVPNGCPQTMLDAVKCIAEFTPFYCHATTPRYTKICHGWYVARREAARHGAFTRTYEFSPT
ncbi:MAG: hypothetical protein ACREF9_14300, partial [Opitutaceae bacterium]